MYSQEVLLENEKYEVSIWTGLSSSEYLTTGGKLQLFSLADLFHKTLNANTFASYSLEGDTYGGIVEWKEEVTQCVAGVLGQGKLAFFLPINQSMFDRWVHSHQISQATRGRLVELEL